MTTKAPELTTTIMLNMPADAVMKLGKRQRLVVLVEKYRAVEAKAKAISAAKSTARDDVLAVGKHGDIVTLTDGAKFVLRDEQVDVDNHKKVAAAFAAKLGLTQKQIDAEYAKHTHPTSKREVKKV